MDVLIRKGVKEDLPQVLSLIKELAAYEKALDEVKLSLFDLEKDGFGMRPAFEFLVAIMDSELVGMSFYFTRYSTWKGRFLYLEDFVVKTSYRGQGIGGKLFEETIAVCAAEGYQGMCWQVLDWNAPAINFYKKYNANISSNWLNGTLTKQQIDEISSTHSPV